MHTLERKDTQIRDVSVSVSVSVEREPAEREKVRNRCRRAAKNKREKGAYGQMEARNEVKRNLRNGIVNSNKYRRPGEGFAGLRLGIRIGMG